MKKHLLIRAFQALTGVLLGLAVVFLVLRSRDSASAPDAEAYFLSDPIPAPTFTLTSHEDESVSSSDFQGRVLAVFFGYTFCPDVCPLTLSHLSRAMEDMGDRSEGIQVLFISVDPDRDSQARLRQFLAVFHSSFLGLTGTEEEIREVAHAFGAYFAKSGEGAEYTVDHTARTFIIDPSGRIPLTFPVTATSHEMARDLTQLLEEMR